MTVGPLVLAPEAAREWMRQDVTSAEAAEIFQHREPSPPTILPGTR
ncbi:Gifsy-2 prophage protein [Klebsiella pneumoniae]|uniref:Gifsy-2 prophage protein n=1 Tax=Klebsiella pneumoniae TaxID=573 RepID=A0A3S5DGX3_KLEPN|nr:Gifsy-2 prophage protein [Klebsiella pneumoniae]